MVNNVFLSSLVPHMYKSEFDDWAAGFLSHYCKEALENPMLVPIENIARDLRRRRNQWHQYKEV